MSYADQIAKRALSLLRAGLSSPTTDFPVAFKDFSSTPKYIKDPDNLPVLAVFILRETRTPDGDYNVGEPHFVVNLTLGISAQIAATEDISQRDQLEAVADAIDNLLLRNPRFINMIEGVVGMTRRNVFATSGDTGHAESQTELTVGYRDRLEPIVPDDLDVINVKTRFPNKDADPAEVEQPWGEHGADYNQNP